MTYLVSFFLANTQGPPGNNFTATFDGQTILSLSEANAFGYQLFSGTAVARGTSAVLSFSGEQDPAFYLLDDVSVEAAPAVRIAVSPPAEALEASRRASRET